MADIELVIKIPEEIYKASQIMDVKYEDVVQIPLEAIRNSTPLPKGHGRLKDIDEIDWYGCTSEDDCPYKNRECKDCDRAECRKTQVDSIPVLIPANKDGD